MIRNSPVTIWGYIGPPVSISKVRIKEPSTILFHSRNICPFCHNLQMCLLKSYTPIRQMNYQQKISVQKFSLFWTHKPNIIHVNFHIYVATFKIHLLASKKDVVIVTK